MVARVCVENVDFVNLVKVMLERISGENTGNTGIKTTSEKSGDALFLKTFAISPLPFVFEFCGILGLIVGRIDVMRAGFKAGVHNGQILIG